MRRLKICPNAYYNYRKQRKEEYLAQKAEVEKQIEAIYKVGYRLNTTMEEKADG